MYQYDSFLYGNGLTLGVLSIIREYSDNKLWNYLNCENFICDFVKAESHKRIIREYLKYFQITQTTKANHDKARSFLYEKYDEISYLGFERWVSKHLFDNNDEYKNIKVYAYILYNYWYHVITKGILKRTNIKSLRDEMGKHILDFINNKNNIFTTNFDNILDDSLNPNHLHGRFHLPLDRIENVILHHFNENDFEYKYLFGTNGLEKLSRIHKLNNISQTIYDLDFFYDDSLNLGSLLIYGIAFGRTEFISDDFLRQYPKHKENKLVRTVDGHILLKLILRRRKKQLNKITIAFYSKTDERNYKELFKETELEQIIEYKQCDEVFNLKDAL
jgi:hypothetical protein